MEGTHNQFMGFELPEETEMQYRVGFKPYGPKNMAKLALFMQESKIESFNKLYDYYISIKPQRQEGESSAELKNRSKFTKILQKYKSYFYDYSVYQNN
jgi:hypothetical protein